MPRPLVNIRRAAAALGAALVLVAPALALAGEAAGHGGEGEHGILIVNLIPGLRALPTHVAGAIVAAVVAAVVGWVGTAGIRSGRAGLAPPARVGAQNFVEVLVQFILNTLDSIIGHEGRRFLPLIGTLAFFILFSNLLGLVPGFLPPTEHIGTTAVLGVSVFLITHYVGVRAHGAGYVRHFLGPVWWLAPLIFVIEIISHLARPLSLSVRLFGNMFGDHQVFGLFSGLIPLVIPAFALGLGLFIALIQTFVFCLLSAMYIAGAVEHGEH